jgi:hypothetical protein
VIEYFPYCTPFESDVAMVVAPSGGVGREPEEAAAEVAGLAAVGELSAVAGALATASSVAVAVTVSVAGSAVSEEHPASAMAAAPTVIVATTVSELDMCDSSFGRDLRGWILTHADG